jgi:hypothetical protein
VIRQLSLPGQIVVYVVPTKENHAKPAWREMTGYLSRFDNIRMVGGNRLSVYNDELRSEMHFISAERATAVRGSAANLLIFDEAAFIDEIVYNTATPLVRTTNGMVYCISTVNPDTPKNRFYYRLVDAEISTHSPDSNMWAKRINLFQNPFISESDKQDIIKQESHLSSFDAEWMANFAESNSFNLKNFWIIDGSPEEIRVLSRYPTFWRAEAFEAEMDYYERYVISYDGAKRKDKPGMTVVGINKRAITLDEHKSQRSKVFADVICSAYIEAADYFEHVDYVVDIWKLLQRQKKPVEIVIDYGGA